MRSAVCLAVLSSLAAALAAATLTSLGPDPVSLANADGGALRPELRAADGTPLTTTYANKWNVHSRAALHEIPALLRTAVVYAEDRRFFEHRGIDWWARAHAAWQNLAALRAVRGASTITEQVVRMLRPRPRPRTVWVRWVEGFEAWRLERTASKHAILEFYLNQVPYASNRRGVVQAARHYFDRDPGTLSPKEQLALAVLVRAPTRLDLFRDSSGALGRIEALAARLHEDGVISDRQLARLIEAPLRLRPPSLPVEATHFARYLYATHGAGQSASVRTSLDASLQTAVTRILTRRLATLHARVVHHGAMLVVDHRSNQILAWVNAGVPGRSHIDAITTPRQPGSTLKPFVYALALERGWTAATPIEDAPLVQPVAHGLHAYRNYSRRYYGPLTLRDALGNSLNTPALRALQFVGPGPFLDALHRLGISSLDEHPDHYGDGLVLGNGEVSLLELVQAYTALARAGVWTPLSFLATPPPRRRVRVFSKETASLIADILSDPDARSLEFGIDGVLELPVQTAIKTGTSSAHHDAWAIGFNYRYTVGAWMGNLDRSPTEGLSGAAGPALAVRSVFSELNSRHRTKALYLSPELVAREICLPDSGTRTNGCRPRTEWFAPDARFEPDAAPPERLAAVRIVQPSPGLHLAMDPRLPDELESFRFELGGVDSSGLEVTWWLNGERIEGAENPTHLWQLRRGRHVLRATIHGPPGVALQTGPVAFEVR